MNNQKKLARQWAETRGQFENRSERERAAVAFILENTKTQTMADVEWDLTEHFLAGAIDRDGDEVVMAGFIGSEFIDAVLLDKCFRYEALREHLTPNGKRYKMVEITKPDHPEVMKTLEDYETAPEDTVIARPGDIPWIKEGTRWHSRFSHNSSEALVLLWDPPRVVLRWGTGDAK